MYKFIFDADALIKLSHAGILLIICNSYTCITTSEVKKEVVDEGKKRLYADAEVIEALINKKLLKVYTTDHGDYDNELLGRGELSVLKLAKKTKNTVVVSDDHAFIKLLKKESIEWLVPVDIIRLLKEEEIVSRAEALVYLDKIKVFIKKEHYEKIKDAVGG